VLYAAVGSFNETSPRQPGHVFKATNVGSDAVWRDISPPSNTPFNAVAIDPRNPQLVYAGSDQCLWHSNDGGASWVKDGLDVGASQRLGLRHPDQSGHKSDRHLHLLARGLRPDAVGIRSTRERSERSRMAP
jgi:hypothetical protein